MCLTRRTICIFCGASDIVDEKYKNRVYNLSEELGKRGCDLYTVLERQGVWEQRLLAF